MHNFLNFNAPPPGYPPTVAQSAPPPLLPNPNVYQNPPPPQNLPMGIPVPPPALPMMMPPTMYSAPPPIHMPGFYHPMSLPPPPVIEQKVQTNVLPPQPQPASHNYSTPARKEEPGRDRSSRESSSQPSRYRRDDNYRASSSARPSAGASSADRRNESRSRSHNTDRERDKDRTDRDRERERDRYRRHSESRRRERSKSRERRERSSSKRPRSKERSSSTASDRDKRKTDAPSTAREERERDKKTDTERDLLLANYRKYYCESSEDITKKLEELSKETAKQDRWIRSAPAELYYERTEKNAMKSLPRLKLMGDLFEEELLKRSSRTKQSQEPYVPPPRKAKGHVCRHKNEKCSSSESSDEEDLELDPDCTMEELSRKISHPYRLHKDLWFNDAGEMNDGPFCRCSAKSRRTGIRHGIYPGEANIEKCDPNSNNADKLFHYRIAISPPTNFLTKTPTIIRHDCHDFIFEGFSLLSHVPISELPICKVIRFNIEYTIVYVEEKMPENFTIRELDLFHTFLFEELLELVDFSLKSTNLPNLDASCPAFHFLPRFVRDISDNGKEVLAMCFVLLHLLDNSGPLVDQEVLTKVEKMSEGTWLDYVAQVREMVVTNPGMKPCSMRVDQLDRNVSDLPECRDEDGTVNPVIVHFGIRPPQLSYAGNPEYQKAWREYVKYRHLVANMSKPSYEDKRKLEAKESRLQEMRLAGRMKRNVTVAVSSKNFHRTGVMCDVVQHAMLIPVLACHLRFHRSLDVLEENIGYKFKNRYLLQLALTHPSYKENFGTNPDHARNTLTNCGIRQPEYGDRKIHYMNTRKRGINTLINIMSRFGKALETDSKVTHNERLEFLGDAVVEFLSSIHLFFMFPDLEEGGLATYRAAIVQNQHLAVLARKFHLEEFMLYAHGSDLCHELELRHAMANCFEALMGALLLDGGIEVADGVFAHAFFMEHEGLRGLWTNNHRHPLQEQEPEGDRKWIEDYQMLQNLTKFEDTIGVRFTHIRLLARAFTDRSIGFTNLTLGSNQRLEFLGDTVLQLICSEFLYRHFPEHHEGHLSLLRSSLVNNRTQSVVCDDLGMMQYAVSSKTKSQLKTKDKADLLEAFLGALYVDKGLKFCEAFCHVCLFPRLKEFIMNQDWNDPKSKLQQCCLTLRTMDGGEPDIPIYKVIESIGPTNTRIYTVAVYFREKRLACATGHSIQQAEMNAAKKALETSQDLFLQLDHQKRVIARSMKRQHVDVGGSRAGNGEGRDKRDREERRREEEEEREREKRKKKREESNLPKQYRVRGESESGTSSSSSNGSSSEDDKGSESSEGEGMSGGERKKVLIKKVRRTSIESNGSAIWRAKGDVSSSEDESDDKEEEEEKIIGKRKRSVSGDERGTGQDKEEESSEPESGEID